MQVEWLPNSSALTDEAAKKVAVTVPSIVSLLADLKTRFERGQGFALATLNLDHVVKLRDDPAFRTAYLAHSHVTADGNPIVWMSRIAGAPVDLMPGADLIAPLCDLAAATKVRVALLGSTEETLTAAARALMARHHGLEVVLCMSPPMGFDPSGSLADSYISQLADADIGLCFLALGAPKQELFAAHAVSKIDTVGFVSIGAGLDFIAGTQHRAPKIIRLIAAEWVWRLLTNPRRLGLRYARCIAVMPLLFWSALMARLRSRRASR
ncbi:WecB/TagA/CpsF family glycosyltransferase [Yoonia sp.]|uniref:WecB/TagA/CpsF family glycosyltransferase n=1 Tax=Yoonia sp. TaxID=2212373 RepID=UPI002DFB9F93|nr:WecB/TagA/CpsF family glycosyltransferase [Yoonia sp.]